MDLIGVGSEYRAARMGHLEDTWVLLILALFAEVLSQVVGMCLDLRDTILNLPLSVQARFPAGDRCHRPFRPALRCIRYLTCAHQIVFRRLQDRCQSLNVGLRIHLDLCYVCRNQSVREIYLAQDKIIPVVKRVTFVARVGDVITCG